MRFFGWLAFLMALIVTIFAIQNSTLPVAPIRLFAWQLKVWAVYTILASLLAGVVIPILLWIPYLIRESFRRRDYRRQIETCAKS